MLWFNFILGFSLFQDIITFDNEFETKEIEVLTKNKIEPQHNTCLLQVKIKIIQVYILTKVDIQVFFVWTSPITFVNQGQGTKEIKN